MDTKKINRTIYCHFSFKRPSTTAYGIFAAAFYSDFAGKKLVTKTIRKFPLWENNQFTTAIQSYEHAMRTIYENQGKMRSAGISQVMLVTDNSTLATWILNPKKNKRYAPFMEQAVKPYRTGSFKEVVLGIGLCQPRKAEKSYKFCQEDLVENEYNDGTAVNSTGYKIDVGEYQSVVDILHEDKTIPIINGISNF